MKTIILAVAIASSVVGCGGGSAGTTTDNSAAINSALTNIAQTLPAASKPSLGAFCNVNGVDVGFIDGSSADDVAKSIALAIVQNSDKFPAEYKAMLSDLGMVIVVYGDLTGTTKFGTVGKMPDTRYIAKVGKGNVIDVVRS